MKNNSAFGLIVIAVLGPAVALFMVSLNPRGTIADDVTEGTGDAVLCGTAQMANDPSVDIDNVTVREVTDGWEVVVSVGPSFVPIFADSFSIAVHVELGLQFGLYDIFDGILTRGLFDINDQIIPGTENNASIGPDGDVIIFFPGPVPTGADLTVQTFHQLADGDPLNCDTAFLHDAATLPPPNVPTSTPTGLPTDTPPAIATPKTPSGPTFSAVFVTKIDADTSFELEGWVIRIFEGGGCTGSHIVSGLTEPLTSSTNFLPRAEYSFSLEAGEYSVAETQQPGWERIGAFCQDFGPGNNHISFRNRKIRNGDVNEDGATNSLDVLLVLQRIAGLIPDPPAYVRADVNDDGVINTIDTALMLQFGAGLLDSLPVGGG